MPYEGPNHTRRRPVYIECRADAMVLQPEGIELGPRDFAGILGAGNPLASALRGEREYFARQATPGKPDSEPYPLLLVRPEGVKTYYAARSALDSWGTDFGYELIGEDWKLTYTEPDPQLAQLLRQIVADARMRMREPGDGHGAIELDPRAVHAARQLARRLRVRRSAWRWRRARRLARRRPRRLGLARFGLGPRQHRFVGGR